MTESTLVELIERYEHASKAYHAWVAAGFPTTVGESPSERAFDARVALFRRLARAPGYGATWRGAAYIATDGGLQVSRGIRPADEIDAGGAEGEATS